MTQENEKDPAIKRAEDAYEGELGSGGKATSPVEPAPPVENPVEDKETGIAP